jgi:serine/threonine protein kinase/tetratricopeptide (TPR) repeat protein
MTVKPLSVSGSFGYSQAEDAELARVLDAYLAAVEAGRPPDVDALTAEHPGIADRLRACLASLQLVEATAERLAAAQNGEDPAAPQAGTLGDFRILREVGRGGMGIVYEAEQISLGRRVALKVLPFAATMDPRHLQRFQNEARAAASLEHPHIVPVYGVGSERGVHYYAMKFIDGQSLAEVIDEVKKTKDTNLKATENTEKKQNTAMSSLCSLCLCGSTNFYKSVAELGIQAAEALEHAHSLGIVHRDIKPANLMIENSPATADNSPLTTHHSPKLWITDFGLARTAADAGLTMTGDVLGTLRYMSPEQALAKHGLVDHRTDVYSLGVTLYELLTGTPAVEGKDREEILNAITMKELKSPRALDSSIPLDMETILLKAMEKNATDRYATAKEMADDLRRYLNHETIRARRPSFTQRARKWVRRHRTATTAVAVCVAVGCLAIVGSVSWAWGERTVRRREAEAKVLEAFDSAIPGLEEGYPWDPTLVSATQRAEAQLSAGSISLTYRLRVEQLLQDVEVLRHLEKARLQVALWSEATGFDFAGADRLYAEAFEGYGLDVASPDAEGTAQRLRNSAIVAHLVAALNHWAYVQNALEKGRGKPLRDLADLADDDSWQRRQRAAARQKDRRALELLAEEAGVLKQRPTNLTMLAIDLRDCGSLPAAERLLRLAQLEYPSDFWINFGLANLLLHDDTSDPADAVRFFQAALSLRPSSTVTYVNLSQALKNQGKLIDAEAASRKAIALTPHEALAYSSLAGTLGSQKRWVEAEVAAREAFALKPEDALFRVNLSYVLNNRGKATESETHCRKAISLKPNLAAAYLNLGSALSKQGRLEEAESALRKAIALEPNYDTALGELGAFLGNHGQLAEAETTLKKAIALKPGSASAHYNLGTVLLKQRKLAEAERAFGKAIALEPNHAEAHCNLGLTLRYAGQFEEALVECRRGHELGSKDPRWPYPSSQWVEEAEFLLRIEARLSAVLTGETQPVDVGELLALAQMCQEYKDLYLAAYRFYTEAFAKQPKLADDLEQQHRYSAACAAALVSSGQGKDVDQIDSTERARLRRQALDWLRADLAAYRQALDKQPVKARPVLERMEHWLQDKDFIGVRGPKALAKLPDAERQEWQKLWEELEKLRKRAAGMVGNTPAEPELVPEPKAIDGNGMIKRPRIAPRSCKYSEVEKTRPVRS